jgi:hypothetical protein
MYRTEAPRRTTFRLTSHTSTRTGAASTLADIIATARRATARRAAARHAAARHAAFNT